MTFEQILDKVSVMLESSSIAESEGGEPFYNYADILDYIRESRPEVLYMDTEN